MIEVRRIVDTLIGDLTLHELKNFLILAETLHFGRASQACNMSASALTRSVQRMEEALGAPLFIRDNRSVVLTQGGEKLRVFALQTLREWQGLLDNVREQGDVGGQMSIYASVTAVYSLLPDLLQSYRAAYPEVQIELRTGSAEESVRQVADGEIDLSVAALPDAQPPGIEFLPLTETNLVFVQSRGERLFSEGNFNLTDVPLVLPRSGLSRRRLDSWMRREGLQPQISAEVSGNEGILAMVRLGSGVGVVPELVLERSPFRDEVEKITSAPELEPYVVGLCVLKRNLRRSSIAALWELADKV